MIYIFKIKNYQPNMVYQPCILATSVHSVCYLHPICKRLCYQWHIRSKKTREKLKENIEGENK